MAFDQFYHVSSEGINSEVIPYICSYATLQWYNMSMTVPNHQQFYYFINLLLRLSTTKAWKIRIIGPVVHRKYSGMPLRHDVIWYDINDTKNNALVTVNNDFWVTSEAICQ